MKNMILKEEKNKRILHLNELKKGMKRLFVVICYVAVVVNIVTPRFLWSIPFVFSMYILWSTLPFNEEKKNDVSLSEFMAVNLFKLALLYLIVVICFNIWWNTLACVLYAALCVEGLIYNFSCKRRIGLKKLLSLIGMTALATGTGLVLLITSFNISNIICFLCGIPVVIILSVYVFSAKKELVEWIERFFNLGKDSKNGYWQLKKKWIETDYEAVKMMI